MYQISSELPEFYRRYYKKHFGFFFLKHSVEEFQWCNQNSYLSTTVAEGHWHRRALCGRL